MNGMLWERHIEETSYIDGQRRSLITLRSEKCDKASHEVTWRRGEGTAWPEQIFQWRDELSVTECLWRVWQGQDGCRKESSFQGPKVDSCLTLGNKLSEKTHVLTKQWILLGRDSGQRAVGWGEPRRTAQTPWTVAHQASPGKNLGVHYHALPSRSSQPRDWTQVSRIAGRFFTPWATAAAKSLQLCPTLCDPIDRSPPASAIPGILQARTLKRAAISFSNAWKWKGKVKSLSHVRLFETPWTAAYQAPLSMEFSRQENWSGVPLPSPLGH